MSDQMNALAYRASEAGRSLERTTFLSAFLDPRALARALGGEAHGQRVLCPDPDLERIMGHKTGGDDEVPL
jgi:hypothetical protein